MDSLEALALLRHEDLEKVARALLEMTRTNAWGHVTVRFQDGKIRQVDTLTTTRCGDDFLEQSIRAA